MGIEAVRRQSIVTFLSQIALTGIGFFSTVYFAHAVGAGVLGAYFLFITYYSIIGLVTDGGFGGAAIKRISEGDEPDAFFSAYFVLRSLFVILVVIALVVFRNYFVDLNSAGVYSWFILSVVASIFLGAIQIGIQGCGKMGVSAVCGLVNDVTRIIVQIIAVFFGFELAGMAGGFVAGLLISTILGFHFFDLHFVRFSWRHVKSLSIFSFWLFLTSSGSMVYSFSDTILIGYFLSNADVGVYRIVMQFTSFSIIISSVLRGVLWPKVSYWGKIGEVGFIEESLSRAFTYSLLLAVPIFAGGVLLGDKLLYFLYGQEFSSGYMTLIVLLIVQVMNVFQFFLTMYLGALDRQKDAFKVTILPVILNIILNIIFIPRIGVVGAAIATLITMILNALLAQQKLSDVMNIKIEYNDLLNILKASFVMFLFVGMFRMFVPISNIWLLATPIVVGMILYVILMLKFNRKIFDELKGIAAQMNIIFPRWL